MPRDKRPYVPLDAALPTNRKLAGLDARAKWLYVAAICWCSQQLSDGVFRLDVLRAVADVPAKFAGTLVDRGLWHDKGHTCPDCLQPGEVGEMVIHHYDRHNRSAAAVRDIREKRAKASREGNHKRYKHPGEVDECSICQE